MCLVVFIASRSPLPLVPWNPQLPAFNVTVLSPHEERVRAHFALPYVASAGSHTGCGCGFNYGRQYPDFEEDSQDRAQALESSALLARFMNEHQVEQIYSCWSGDEAEPKVSDKKFLPETLVATEFFFQEKELLTIGLAVA